jgi:hypothetical protein
MRNLYLGLSLSLSLTLLAGCSSNSGFPGHLSGRVFYKDEAVKGGTISFHSQKLVRTVPITPEGLYEFVDLPEGPAVITVSNESFNPNNKQPVYGGAKMKGLNTKRAEMEAKMGKPASGEAAGAKYRKLPGKYALPEKSPLSVTIESGRQEKNFVLTD